MASITITGLKKDYPKCFKIISDKHFKFKSNEIDGILDSFLFTYGIGINICPSATSNTCFGQIVLYEMNIHNSSIIVSQSSYVYKTIDKARKMLTNRALDAIEFYL